MKVVCAGGGSGGHVTPVLAVINELKKKDPQLKAWFLTERGFAPQARDIMRRSDIKVPVKLVPAGKIRRYYGVPAWRQLLHVPTQLLNARDMVLLSLGSVKSAVLLSFIRPDVVFTKGGFVCVPVGLAARILRIPLVVHDSDTHPGLTNRLLSRWAKAIATGAPLEYYSYPRQRSHYIGIPVSDAYRPVSEAAQQRLKRELGYPAAAPVVLVTGGGLGAQRINEWVAGYTNIMETQQAYIMHVTGTKHLKAVRAMTGSRKRYGTAAFLDETMPDYVRAADVVVVRAGATTLLELAAAAKPAVIIPHPHLPGGHQLKNAEVYAKADAAVMLTEEDLKDQPDLLPKTLDWLLQDGDVRQKLSANIQKFAKPRAAADMAQLIISAAQHNRPEQPT